MGSQVDAAMIGLLGVAIGAAVSVLGTIVVPWVRDSLERKRVRREAADALRTETLLNAMGALMQLRQSRGAEPARGDAQARFGVELNRLIVVTKPDEQPVIDVLMLMLAMIQDSRSGGDTRMNNMVGEAMQVLSLWARGDIKTDRVIAEVEDRADVDFAPDRRSATARNSK